MVDEEADWVALGLDLLYEFISIVLMFDIGGLGVLSDVVLGASESVFVKGGLVEVLGPVAEFFEAVDV